MKNLIKKISAIMLELGPIAKDQQNTQFKFRGIDQVYNALSPLMAKHGVVCYTKEILHHESSFSERQKGTYTQTIYTEKVLVRFCLTDGESELTFIDGATSIDFGDKAFTQAMSMAEKYGLLRTFKVPTEELKKNDADSRTPEMQTNLKELPEKKVADEKFPTQEVLRDKMGWNGQVHGQNGSSFIVVKTKTGLARLVLDSDHKRKALNYAG